MSKSKFSNLFEDNRFLFALSLFIAITLWTYVVVYVNNRDTTTIRSVPINMQYRQSMYQSMGLDVIETDISTVDVIVTGPRSVTGDLTADDIIIYPSITNIDGAGTYKLALTYEKTSNVKNFTINSLSTDSVTVRLDKVVTKEFQLDVDISTIIVDSDKMADRPTATPAILTVTGPEFKVSTIDRAVAATTSRETLSQSAVLPGNIILYDENDGVIDQKLLTLDKTTVDITVPIMKEVTVPVTVEYVNVPDGFDTAVLNMSLSVNEIRLAVPAKDAGNLTKFVAGYIDLSTLQTDQPYVLDIKLPTGYRNMDDIKQVNVTISSENLMERSVNVDEIKILNDANESIQVLTQIISNVTVIGDKEAVEALSHGSVIAQIDASRLSAAQGQQTVEVNFIIPSTDKAYVKGVYTATIKI
ncbi:MAG: hypothetical protein IKU54_05600 [Oscillospiraceae bacterium]|nr:hypothetical protein [Oscillospiraceae bacterium]